MSDLIAISAMSKNKIIGDNGEIPWYYKEDIEHYKETVKNENLIIGRKTFENSPAADYTDNTVIVLSKSKNINDKNVKNASNVKKALKIVQKIEGDFYIVGGESIYRLFLPYTDKIILSVIPEKYSGDKYFPELTYLWDIVDIKYKNTFNVYELERSN